jgi:hypothetical protein
MVGGLEDSVGLHSGYRTAAAGIKARRPILVWTSVVAAGKERG